ncbi:hypothetical protein H4P35_01785 [Achromobacter sp. 77]|uniref:T6SS effector BTH_I2691 family protein n=1 Tax=Achromobacter sp. 77 TaxID=2756133 RepID=UPI001D00F04B|nr:T6SS effector BTH_I2691 family protein [Achromobacter sp. 77]UDG76122.1 hypothetical protein H4P35_01785 [Achromobacter sp. 77]
MSISKTLTQARRQAAPNPTGTCSACERTGLPILPLRLAVMPLTDGLKQHGALSHESIQTALRVLRQGYVYVLLDKEIWHAYQVTPEGYLRQFNPFSLPRAAPEPLAKACLDAGHDLRSAFINIDTAAHKQAWIAFSQDPWPKATLDAYRTGKHADGKALPADYRDRFRGINLITLKQDPTGGNQALGLEHGDDLAQHVAEYAIGTRDFGSVHDWHPRHARLEAMQAQLRMLEKQHGLAKGVAGLILPDPVGMATELNSLRLSVNTMRQRWREEPTRRYAYLTSQCLLGFKAYIAQQVAAAHPPPPPPSDYWTSSESGVPPVFHDPAQQRAGVVNRETGRRMARLEDRYWETGPAGRKTFQDAYDKEDDRFQKQIDAYATDWADLVAGASWRRIMALDYADADARSQQCRLSTTAACLAGGITDAPPQEINREAKSALRQVNAGLKNLEPAAAAVLEGLQVGAAGARRVAGSTFASLKNLAVGSVDGGLSFIGLYFLQDSLKSTLADLDAKVGARHPEAVVAFYSVALGFMGASVEAAGLAIKVPADAARGFVLRWGVEKTPVLTRVVGLGSKMVMVGGAISALAGIADAGASFRAGIRVIKAGEAVVAIPYAFSGFLSIIGAGLTYFGVTGSLALFGALGAGVVVGLVAYAMLQIAKILESDTLEKWARRCYFGRTEGSEHWRDPENMDVAIAALNAAVLGMDVDLRFSDEGRARPIDELYSEDIEVLKNRGAVIQTKALVYRAILPGFDTVRSRYRFTLTIERFGLAQDGKRSPTLSSHVMASGQVNDTAHGVQTSDFNHPDYTLVGETKPTSERPILSGRYWLDPINTIKSATFAVAFWPDKDDSTGFAAIEITEEI